MAGGNGAQLWVRYSFETRLCAVRLVEAGMSAA